LVVRIWPLVKLLVALAPRMLFTEFDSAEPSSV
jgi:hypothetical protein